MDAARRAGLPRGGRGQRALPAAAPRAATTLQAQQHIEPRYGGIAEVLQGALAQVEDACHDLARHHADQTELDLDGARALTSVCRNGCRWRGASAAARGTAGTARAMAAPARRILDRSVDLDGLHEAENAAQQALLKAARKVSAAREQAAARLSLEITAAMQGLGMNGGRLRPG